MPIKKLATNILHAIFLFSPDKTSGKRIIYMIKNGCIAHHKTKLTISTPIQKYFVPVVFFNKSTDQKTINRLIISVIIFCPIIKKSPTVTERPPVL